MPTGVNLLDRYSTAHAAMGAVFGFTQISPLWAFASHIAFEVIEDRLKDAPRVRGVFPDTRHDSLANHVGDVLTFMAGFGLARAGRTNSAAHKLAIGTVTLGGAVWGYNARRASLVTQR